MAIVRRSRERGLPLVEATAFRAIPGEGIYAQVDGDEVLVGNACCSPSSAWPAAEVVAEADRLRDEGKTAVFVGDRQAVRGIIAVADTVRPSAQAVIAELKRQGSRGS